MASDKSFDKLMHRLGDWLTFVANDFDVAISGRIEDGQYVSEISITCIAHLHGNISNLQLEKVDLTISEANEPIFFEGEEKPALGVLWKSKPATNVGIILEHKRFTHLLSVLGAVNSVEQQKLVISVLPSQNVEDWKGDSKVRIDEVTVRTRKL